MRLTHLFCAAFLILPGITQAQVVFNPANNHYYERVDAALDGWQNAVNAAASRTHLGMRGHLVTITSQAENDFIVNNLGGDLIREKWTGAYQTDNNNEPGGSWAWITGEAWSYTNWQAEEPNNLGNNEHTMSFKGLGYPLGSWNDVSFSGFSGYLVEYEPAVWRVAWQNTQNGDVTYWLMNGTSRTSTGLIASAIPTVWRLVGAARLNNDNSNDLIWHNTQTGDLTYWLMNGTTRTAVSGTIQRNVPLAWRPMAVADLNNDNKKDIIWQNTQTGDVSYWLLNGATVDSTGYLARAVPLVWQIAAALDLNSDSKPDLLWRNTQNGDITYWLMNGTIRTAVSGYLQRNVPLAWRVAAVADIDADGDTDLIWHNTQSGDVSAWRLQIGSVVGYDPISFGVPTVWQMRGAF
jgi:hypothetical protein